jgi:ribulose-5-phosphate 4-epimerase/fuculose-1-phosphate aldolase
MRKRPTHLLEKLVTAHRILVDQRVLDAFGHISVRDEVDANVFWLSSALPPSRSSVADMIPFDLDGNPLEETKAPLFSERFIHSSIYRMRNDVHSVAHHHSHSIMPFCIAPVPLRGVSQTGGFMGSKVALWDSADAFGATKILVDSVAQADSLAASLGQDWIVLMRGHGATVAGRTIEDVTFKSVFSCRDADHLLAALKIGTPIGLSDGEIARIGQPGAPALERAWQHWTAGLDMNGTHDTGRNDQ